MYSCCALDIYIYLRHPAVCHFQEPFQDRYAIFGIDVEDGQRYELRLTSDEVSSILDGGINSHSNQKILEQPKHD